MEEKKTWVEKLAAKKVQIEQEFGQVVLNSSFVDKTVTFYSKGYVKVGMLGGVEKLIDIFGETDISKKTGIGRGVFAIATGGLNLALSPSQRGNVILTISTDRQTYTVLDTKPTNASIKRLNEIVSSGKALLRRTEQGSSTASSQVASVSDELQKLAELHRQGLLTDQEFQAAKAKLLG